MKRIFFNRRSRPLLRRADPRGPASSGECVHVAHLLHSYLDGELDPTLSSEVAEHLDVCRRCGLEADAYAELKQCIRDEVTPPPGSIQRLQEFADGLLSEGSSADAGARD